MDVTFFYLFYFLTSTCARHQSLYLIDPRMFFVCSHEHGFDIVLLRIKVIIFNPIDIFTLYGSIFYGVVAMYNSIVKGIGFDCIFSYMVKFNR